MGLSTEIQSLSVASNVILSIKSVGKIYIKKTTTNQGTIEILTGGLFEQSDW